MIIELANIEFGLGLLDSNEVCTAGAAIGILPKIESADSVGHLSAILDAADGAMVARGDLGAELPVQEVSCHTAAPQMLLASMSTLFEVLLCPVTASLRNIAGLSEPAPGSNLNHMLWVVDHLPSLCCPNTCVYKTISCVACFG